MKLILWSLLFALLAVNSKAQDINTALGIEVIDVPAGKVCEILNFQGPVFVRKDMESPQCFLSSVNFNGSSQSLSLAQPFPIVGPALITVGVSSPYTATAVLTYRMKDNLSTTTTTPTSAVVIPTDATGPVNVILESSTDLVNWTQANPGTYGASTTKRFFRVRAVNQ